MPKEIQQGYTPDISPFRYAFYKPIWFFKPPVKSLEDLAKARYLYQAESLGDTMTFFIIMELEKGKPKILIQLVIWSWQKKKDTADTYINNDPMYKSFFFSNNKGRRTIGWQTIDEHWDNKANEGYQSENNSKASNENVVNDDITDHGEEAKEPTPEEALTPETNATNMIDEVDIAQKLDGPFLDNNFEFSKILDHQF